MRSVTPPHGSPTAAGAARALGSAVRLACPLGLLVLPLAWQWRAPLGGVLDAGAATVGLKLWFALLIATSFFWLERASLAAWLARGAEVCERRTPLVLGALLAGLYAIAWVATSPIAFGAGAEGLGYGDDGQYYGHMTDRFAWSGRATLGPYCFRPLVPILVHLLGLGTFAGFKLVNAASHVGAGLLVYALCRRAGGTRTVSLFAVALFGTLKFGLKFWVYYPILTDGAGTLFLLAAVHASLAGRHGLFAAVVGVGVFCRENLVLLIGFHVLRAWRTAPDRRLPPRAVAVQAVPLALFALSRWKPIFRPGLPYFPMAPIRRNLTALLLQPYRRAAVLLAFPNALGMLLALPVLRWRALGGLLVEIEWAYYTLATLALSLTAGADVDRFALWQVPLLVVALARVTPRPTPWLAVHLLALHVVAMEFPLAWGTSREFYLSRYATHTQAPAFPYLVADCVVPLVLAAAMIHGGREPASAAAGDRHAA